MATVKEVAQSTNYSERAVQRAAQRGRIDARKVGRRWDINGRSPVGLRKKGLTLRAPHKARREAAKHYGRFKGRRG